MKLLLILSRNRQEGALVRQVFGDLTNRDLSVDWLVRQIQTAASLPELVAEGLLPEISCVDIEGSEGVTAAERVRAAAHETLLLILTSPQVSPITYIRPNVMPSGVLLRPLQRSQLLEILPMLLREIHRAEEDAAFGGESFTVSSHGTLHRIPMKDILYFEARNKKLYLVTAGREIEFYDTLDKLLSQLPADFLRCHKSFVVNRRKAEGLLLAESLILMEGGTVRIPISRSLKQTVKEAFQ